MPPVEPRRRPRAVQRHHEFMSPESVGVSQPLTSSAPCSARYAERGHGSPSGLGQSTRSNRWTWMSHVAETGSRSRSKSECLHSSMASKPAALR
eukprot:3252213-Prymnesium_polylepis.2